MASPTFETWHKYICDGVNLFCSIVLLSELSMLVAIVSAVLKIVNLFQHYEITQLYPDASL